MNYYKIIMVIFLCFSLLIGCSNAEREETIAQAKDTAKVTLNEKKLEPTKKVNGISFFLPTDFKIEHELENNIMLKKGNNEYILFVNPNEPPNSAVPYEKLKASKDDKNLDSFKEDQQFGYISIAPMKDRNYELIVGIGGIKMTTKTLTGDMVKNTKIMMQIVNSVNYSKPAEKPAEKSAEKPTGK